MKPLIKIGQRVYNPFHWAGRGIVVGIDGEQRPATVQQLAGGAVVMGGSAHFDVIYETGVQSVAVPEAILRGYRISDDDVASADEILNAIKMAAAKDARDLAIAEAEAKSARTDATRYRAENPHLIQARDAPRDWPARRVAAENIRRELKRRFIGVKFSVTSRRGGSSINIAWTDGPSIAAVHEVTARHEQGHFDGMTDCYHYSKNVWADVFGGAQYVFTERSYSQETALAAQLAGERGLPFDTERPWLCEISRGESVVSLVRQILADVDLTTLSGRVLRLARTHVTCGRLAEFWRVEATDLATT